jgi:hydroxypyruvate reductase
MSKIVVLVTNRLMPNEMATLASEYDVVDLKSATDPEKTLRERALDIRAIVSWGASTKLIQALPNLEIIAQNGVGVDNIDLVEAKARSIAVTNTPDVLTDDTADTALALLLGVSRRVAEGDMFVRAGRWAITNDFPLGTSLSGKMVGIVGLGRIGQAIARRCLAFNMTVVYHGPRDKHDQPYRYYPDLVTMARDVDYLMLSCVGGANTKNMVNRTVLDAMKTSAFLINVARGSVIDESVLVEKLVNRKIAGAGLDVYAHEPNVPDELKSLDNVVLLPHIGSATYETRTNMGRLVLDNLAAHFAGKPLLTPVL